MEQLAGKKQFKISIITPSYNQGCYIEDAVQSVLTQGYENFEHIIIDGGSSDSTLDVLSRYPHLKWVSEPDEGQSDALNKGLFLASGDVIGWLNADDAYEVGAFDTAIAYFRNDPEIDMVYGNYYEMDSEGKILRSVKTHKFDRKMCYLYCYIPSTTVFFKRDIIDEGIKFGKKFNMCMDKDFFAHLALAGKKIVFTNKYIARFRWHSTNKSLTSVSTNKEMENEGMEIFYKYYKPGNKRNKRFTYLLYRKIYYIKRVYYKLLQGR